MPLVVKIICALFFASLAVLEAGAQEFNLVDVPAGTAQFGDVQGDDNEVISSARLPSFRLMRTEVTNRQFKRFVDETGYRTTVEMSGEGYVWWKKWQSIKQADWRRPQGPQSSLQGLELHPVVQVSAIDAQNFCQYYGMRLPSENEWEYAARGPLGVRYPWGNDLKPSMLAQLTNAGTIPCCAASQSDGYSRTAPVGLFPAGRSSFGLDDMAGNVWEWTSSLFPGTPKFRVIRGGGWGNNPYCLRTAYRHGNPPDIGLDMVGFRCAADKE